MGDDRELLRRYLASGDQEAFAELVRRHVDLVHGTCRRSTGDAHLAEDLTQAVFLLLASRGARIGDGIVLSGWLHRTACYISANARRGEAARRRHEVMAGQARVSIGSAEPIVADQALDKALSRLKGAERDAVLLRFFQGMSAREVGAEMGVSEEAAKKRVSRGLDRLKELLGGSMSAGAVSVLLAQAREASAAPVGLAEASIHAAAQGLAGAGPAAVLAKGAIQMMAYTRIGVAAACVGVALLAGAGVMVVKGQVPPAQQQQVAQGQPAAGGGEAPAARPPRRAQDPVLGRPIPEARFDMVTLGDVISFLQDVTGVKFEADWNELKEARVEKDSTVTMRLSNMPLGKTLEVLLWEAGGPGKLDYVLEGGVLKISTAKALKLPEAEKGDAKVQEAAAKKVLDGPLLHPQAVNNQPVKAMPLDMTLGEAVDFYADSSRVGFWVNWKALADAGVKKETRVKGDIAAESTLESALKVLVSGAQTKTPLDYACLDGIIVISTMDDLKKIREIKPVQHVR